MKYIILTAILAGLLATCILIKQDTEYVRDGIGMCEVSTQVMTPANANMTDARTGYAVKSM